MCGPLVRLSLLRLGGSMTDDLLLCGLFGLVVLPAGCVRGSLPFPLVELRGVANEVLLLHGTSTTNAANLVAGVFGVVCGGVGANPVLPWPTSSARPTVVPCCLSKWTARGTVWES